MATIRFLLGILCLVTTVWAIEPSSDFLGGRKGGVGKVEGREVEGLKVEGWKVEGLGFGVERLAMPKVEGMKVEGVKVERKKVEGLKVEGLGFDVRLTNRKALNPTAELQSPNAQLQFLHSQPRTPISPLQAKILQIARSQLGVREATGKNDGTMVEAYLSYTGNKKGEPWCASFVSWVFGKAGFTQPRTAWSPALFPKQRQILQPLPASLFGIFYPKLGRVAHCGLVEASKGNWVYTIEGNTNTKGAREGDGVYRKLRHQRTISLYADWQWLKGKEFTR